MIRNLFFAAGMALLINTEAKAQTVVALTTAGELRTFNASTPGTVSAGVNITGMTSGQVAVGMDFRPNTGELYVLGYDASVGSNNAQLYTVNYTTGVATAAGASSTLSLGTGNVGFDFNPTVDRIRVVGSNGANYRLHPTTGALVATDGNLAFATGDVNVAETPSIGSVAYSNSYIASEATVLYGIDDSLNTFVIQNPPNAGTLNTVGLTGINFNAADATADMDIFFDPATNTNIALLVANTGSAFDQLYSVNLGTGVVTLAGTIGTGNVSVSDIAIVIDRNTPAMTGDLIYGLTRVNRNLVTFDSDNPEYIRTLMPLTGLTTGQVIVGMDVRPADLQLYALGYNSGTDGYQLYTVNTSTGALTAVGAGGTIALGAGNVGFDFNPVVDRIRVVSSSGANFRLNPNDGSIAGTDAMLTYDPSDVAFGNTPNVSGVAYLNSYAGIGGTTLMGIDDNLGSLVTIPNPNAGVLTTTNIGVYTFNMADLTTDIDFFFDSTNSGFNVGYIAANTGTSTNDQLYEMTIIGNPVLVGNIGLGVGIVDIASQLLYTGTTNLSSELSTAAVGSLNNGLRVYPNPATEVISLDLAGSSEEAEVLISDLVGKIVVRQPLTDRKVSISNIPAGVYILQVKTSEQVYAPVKFVKR
jgi:hypothetical protein